MAKLPTLLGDIPTPQVANNTGGYTPDNYSGQMAMGKAMENVSGDAQTVVDRDQGLLAAQKVNDAQTAAQNYLYDPETGILNKKGADAIGLKADAAQQMTKINTAAMEGVTDPRIQVQMKKELMGNTRAVMETTMRHESGERIDYASSLADGQISNATTAMTLQPNDDQLAAGAEIQVRNAVESKAKLKGWTDPTLIDYANRAALSDLRTARINALLDQGGNANIAMAGEVYDKAVQDQTLAPAAIAELGHKLKTIVPDAKAQVNFDNNRNNMMAAPVPADELYQQGQVGEPGPDALADLKKGVVKFESGGNANAVGPEIPGQGTAKGLMQVMDATNSDPGFGVVPAKDNSPEERVRVGNDYLAAMVSRYGDNRLALAAYNAGPGNVDKALAASDPRKGGDFNTFIQALPKPQETGPYVNHIMANVASVQVGTGQGYDPAVIKSYVDAVPDEQKPYLVAKIKADHDTQVASFQQGRNQAIDAMQVALGNNNGNMSAVPADVRAGAMKYGVLAPLTASYGKSDDVLLNQLAGQNTDQLLATDFNDPNIRMRLSAKDLQTWQKKQSDIVTNPANQLVQRNIDGALKYAFQTDNINNPVTGQAVTPDQMDAVRRRTEMSGAVTADDEGNLTTDTGKDVNPDKNNAALYDKFVRVKGLVTQQVISEYEGGNKQAATPENIRNLVDKILIDDATGKERQIPVAGSHNAPGTTFWQRLSGAPQVQNTTPVSDLRVKDIPATTRANIENYLKSQNKSVSETTVMQQYVKTLIHARNLGPYMAGAGTAPTSAPAPASAPAAAVPEIPADAAPDDLENFE